MKKVLLILFLLILVPQVTASEKKLYDQWHYFEDEFVYADQVYAIKMFPYDENRLKISVDEENYFVNYDPDQNDCAVAGYNKICYYSQSYDFKYKSFFDKDENQVPGVRISIWELYDKTSIKITKRLEPRKLHIGERGVIFVTIANQGEATAFNVLAQEHIPEGLKFFSSSGVDYNLGDELQVIRNLPPGKSVSYSYQANMVSFDTQNAITNLSWNFEGVNETFITNAKIDVPLTGWKAEYAWARSVIDVDETVFFVLTLDNKDEESADVKIQELIVTFPRNLLVIPLSSEIVKTSLNQFKIEDTIPAGRVKKYEFTGLAEFTGEYVAEVKLVVSSSGGEFTDEENVTLKVGKGKVIPKIGVSPDIIRSGNDVTLLARIENSELDSFYQINGTLFANGIYYQEFNYEKIHPAQEIKVNKQNKVRIPVSQLEQEYLFVLNGTYLTTTGEQGFFHTQSNVIAKPGTQSFAVTISPEKTYMNLEDENTITVAVTNLLGDGVTDVVIKDTYSRPVNLVSGQNKESLDLLGKTKKQAYIYKFRLPSNFPEDSLDITTELTSESKNYREVYITTIAVNRTVLLEVIIDDEGDGENNGGHDGEEDDGKDDGWEEDENPEDKESSGFWDSVKDFFKLLFTKR